MKSWVKRNLALILALIIICSVCLLFCSRKEGMFIDEVYSYGLANSYYAPYVTDIKGGDMTDKIFTRAELTDYLAVMGDDAFAAGSVYYNQTRDVHPPLYYWLLNFVSSLCAGHFSMWIGLGLNLIIYVLTLVTLYKLAELLFSSRLCAVAAVLIYGLSTIGLSTMLMIRMYMLLTLFTVLLAYLIARLDKTGDKKLYLPLAFTIFAGLMTQYYFVFYAFFLCGFYVISLAARREWRAALRFSAAALLGVVGLVAAFPACFDQLFADALVSGGSAVENLMSVSQYAARITTFTSDTAHRMKAAIYLALLFAALDLVFIKKLLAAREEKGKHLMPLAVIIPAFVAFIVIAVISPVVEIRYIYNIAPMFVLAVCALLSMAERAFPAFVEKRGVKAAAGAAIAALCLWQARGVAPDYLYDEYSDYDALLCEHADAPCVYIDDNYFSPITYDMLQLMVFDDFLVTNDTESEALSEYTESAAETVVFIDISKQWASGYDAGEILSALEESMGFSAAEALYSNGFSAVYLLKMGG